MLYIYKRRQAFHSVKLLGHSIFFFFFLTKISFVLYARLINGFEKWAFLWCSRARARVNFLYRSQKRWVHHPQYIIEKIEAKNKKKTYLEEINTYRIEAYKSGIIIRTVIYIYIYSSFVEINRREYFLSIGAIKS